VQLIREPQAHAPEEEEVFDVLLDELVGFRNEGLGDKDHVLGVKLVRPLAGPVKGVFEVEPDGDRLVFRAFADENRGTRVCREALGDVLKLFNNFGWPDKSQEKGAQGIAQRVRTR
jgi:hypothetical protein